MNETMKRHAEQHQIIINILNEVGIQESLEVKKTIAELILRRLTDYALYRAR